MRWLSVSALGAALLCAPGCGDRTSDEGEPEDEGAAEEDDADDDDDDAQGDDDDDATGESGGEDLPDGPQDGEITYHRDVRPLLERHCVSCHQPGQIAPFSFMSYDEVWPLREAIALAASERTMPPWNPGQGCADYVGDPSLSKDEIDILQAWVDEDGPVGDEKDYAAPEVEEPPGLSRVDVSLTLPEPYEPQLQPDDYRCFVMDWPYDEPNYITGFQVTPDNLEIVHHVITYAIEPGAAAYYDELDAADPGPGYTCFGGPGGGSNDWGNGRWLGAWAPGAHNTDFPEGTGLRMEPGTKVVVQVHYNSSAEAGGVDQSTVDYKVDDSIEREAYMMPWANPDWLSGLMRIPAGEEATHVWRFDPTIALPFITDAVPGFQPIEIHSASHHMHLRGKVGRQAIERAGGDVECLLDIGDYDFNWQTRYRFSEPKILYPGDDLALQCTFHNTDGDSELNWGEGTEDEMCLGVYFITTPK